MKIWFEHPYGRLDKYDMQWVKVFADVEPEEQEQALAQGYIDIGDRWSQVRSSRINIKKYIDTAPKFKQRKGVTVEKWSGSFAIKHQTLLEDVYDQFIQHFSSKLFSGFYVGQFCFVFAVKQYFTSKFVTTQLFNIFCECI